MRWTTSLSGLWAEFPHGAIYVMTLGRSTAGINNMEVAGAAYVQVRSIDPLRRVLPTRLTSYTEFRGCTCQETLWD